jgi:hypothetical protein
MPPTLSDGHIQLILEELSRRGTLVYLPEEDKYRYSAQMLDMLKKYLPIYGTSEEGFATALFQSLYAFYPTMTHEELVDRMSVLLGLKNLNLNAGFNNQTP